MSVTTVAIDDSETLFTVTFNSTVSITTTVTSSSAVAAAWISATVTSASAAGMSNNIVGLDCEWRPNLSASSDHPVAILQLCAAGPRCLIFQILHADAIPPSLLSFLNGGDSRFTFVGVGIGEDAEKLMGDHEIGVRNRVDLRGLARERTGRAEMKQMGVARLAAEVIGVEVKKPKRVQMSRWDQEWLMLDQIGYACVDAYLCFEIGRRLTAGEF